MKLTSGGTTYYPVVRNCVFYGNNQYGIEAGAAIGIDADHNAFGSNSAGNRLNIDAGANDITLSGDPFTNAAGGDFTIADSVAGDQLVSAGFPTDINGQTNYLDLGALQEEPPAGNGGDVPSAPWAQPWG
jgi:hypothetical protein